MNYKRVLVFWAHPDDELTMARSIAKFSKMGVKVTVVIMTNGCEGYPDPKLKNKIVDIRAKEAKDCDKVLGIHKKIIMDIPDMGLTNDKPTVKKMIKVIRQAKPDAIFTHGPFDVHRDHIATHHVTKSAYFHAGEPVASDLGKPWKTPYLYYYKAVKEPLPRVVFDVSDMKEKSAEALATQKSQYKVFRKTDKDFKKQVAALKQSKARAYDFFWIAEPVLLTDLLPLGIDAPDNYFGSRASEEY